MTAQERDFLTAPIDDVGYVDFAPSKRVKEFSADEQAIYKMLKGYGVYDHLDGAGEYLDNDISLADDLKAWIADTIADYDRRVASIIAERDQWQTRAEERDGWLEKCLTRTRWLTSQRGEQRNLPDVWLWHHTDTEYVPGMVPPDAEDIAEGWSAVRYIAAPPSQDPTR